MTTIAIVEDNIQLAEQLQDLVSSFDKFKVLFVANNGIELIDHLKCQQPQLIIMDIEMPKMNGIESVKYVKQQYPNIKIVMHSVLNNDNAIVESIMNGANGYILKNEKAQKLIDALEEVLDGGAPITPSVAQKLIKYLNYSQATIKKVDYNLSEREFQILANISQGLTYKLIADKLFISTKTVGKHIENIYSKLHVNNKVDAVNIFREINS